MCARGDILIRFVSNPFSVKYFISSKNALGFTTQPGPIIDLVL